MSGLQKNAQTEHDHVHELLSAYLDGELLPDERQAVQHHLDSCPACRWELDTLRQTVQWTQDLPVVSLPRAFTIPVPAPREAVPRRIWRLVPVMQAATALVALLLVFVVTGDTLLTLAPRIGSVQPYAVMEQQADQAQSETTTMAKGGGTADATALAPQAMPRNAVPQEVPAAGTQVVEEPVAEVESAPLAAPRESMPAEGESAMLAVDEATASGMGAGPSETQDNATTAETRVSTEIEKESERGMDPAPEESESVEAPAAQELASTAAPMPTAIPPSPMAVQAEELAATKVVQAGEPVATEPTFGAAPTETEEPGLLAVEHGARPTVPWLRLAEVGLGLLFIVLALSTLTLTLLRRRAR